MMIDKVRISHVMIVDDDPTSRRLLSESLCRAGFEVEAYGDGTAALRHLVFDEQVAALVTDVYMPGFSNGMFLALEARILRPALPVVYISARPLSAAHGVEGAHFLRKPYQVELIAPAVRDAIASAKLLMPIDKVGRAA